MLENTIKMLVNTLDYYYKDNLIDGVSTDTSGSNYVMSVDYSLESAKCTLTDGYNTSTLDTIIQGICHYEEVLQRESDIEVNVTLI